MNTGNNAMQKRFGKAELLREIEDAWVGLNESLGELTQQQMTEIRDAEGWTVVDHILHMAAWERSAVALLQGRPRYEGLGVDRQLLLMGGADNINAAIQKQREDLSVGAALSELHEVHSQLLNMIEPLNDVDLNKAVRDYQPEPEGAKPRDERPVSELIYGESAEHFREHQRWIESLVSQGE